ncbi:MAG: methyltransferase [Bacillota bacterium]
MNKRTLEQMLLNETPVLDEQLPSVCESAWRLFEEGGPAASAALTLMCRAAKKAACRDAIKGLAGNHEALEKALFGESGKMRKNAARLMGALKREADDEALIRALKSEPQRLVRPSILLALGALKTPRAIEALSAYVVEPPADETEQKHFREESEALQSALSNVVKLLGHAYTGLKKNYELELRTPAGFSATTAKELESFGFAPYAVKEDRLRIRAGSLEKVFLARGFFEALFPVALGVPARPDIVGGYSGDIVRLMQDAHDGQAPYAYRIELRGEVEDRASFIRGAAGNIDGKLLLNAPSQYEMEVRLELKNAVMDVFVKLFTREDTRFSYRAQSLPASIHPATAAAMLRFAGDLLKPGARVLDPCCGSGTMLFERELLLPASALTGVDIAHRAIEISRQNAKGIESRARFIVNDCLRFEANRAYDEVISNLPFGNRVGSHGSNEKLYAGIVKKLPSWLAPGGVALLYTMEHRLLERLLKEAPELALIKKARAEAGGLHPYLFLIHRR